MFTNNHSRGYLCALVDISLDSSADLASMKKSIKEACEKVAAKNEDIIPEGPNVLCLQDFDSSKIVIRVLAKTVIRKQGMKTDYDCH